MLQIFMVMKRNILSALSILLGACGAFGAELLVQAESFDSHGGWSLDQQFMDHMGSPYLIAHGLGKPVEDAVTTVDIPEAGRYTAWVRTYNWTSPWEPDRKGPGAFRVSVNGRRLASTAGDSGSAWEWQRLGEVYLKKGKATIALHDLTGFDGRCDAVLLSSTPGFVPVDSYTETATLDIPDTEQFDFVVVGGGIAGMCAAVSAARQGLRTALVNDRPVLGGCNSSEIRVHLGGHSEIGPYPALGRMIREFGHSRKGNAQPAANYEDEKKDSFIRAEKLVTLFAPYHAVSVDTDGNRINGVTICHTSTGDRVRLSAPLFADCTGDGSIGCWAGADWTVGREARSTYGEPLAPEVADSLVMGASVQWYSKDDGRKSGFPVFDYGIIFSDSTCQRLTMGEWKWETGMRLDPVRDAEKIRDYGMLVVYANWSYLKNRLADNDKFRNRSLEWVAYVNGKRESRRLLGDYILKQDDIDKGVTHEDASFTTTWSIDLHFPDPENSRHFPGREFKAATNHIFIHPYAVPYRCLYSRNIDNLFMAGRCISVSHVALGTVRVMRTTGMMGEVVGMAAGICYRNSTTPRGVYLQYLPELKELMAKGAGRPADELPDNQRFNLANKLLPAPRALLDCSGDK